jgi:hypothetical protein
MPFQPERKRCKNCRKFFMTTRVGQLYHSEKCRRDFNNYGKTPVEQLVRRLNSFMRTPAWKAMIQVEIQKALPQLVADEIRKEQQPAVSAPGIRLAP